MKHFEILNKLNELDAKNGTSFVGICPDVIAVDKKGNNGEVKIGIPGHVAQELVLSDMKHKSLQLLIIDIDEYNVVKAGDDTFFKDSLPQALHVLNYNLRCEEEYRRSWTDNIAMAFQDAFWRHMEPVIHSNDAGKQRIRNIANEAAEHFIGTLTQTNAG